MRPSSQIERSQSLHLRRIARLQLSAYLCVYNSVSGQSLGYIGNLSCIGIMLISSLPVMLDQDYQLELRFPNLLTGSEERLSLLARSHWCRADINPGHYDCGFSLREPSAAFVRLTSALQQYFSFAELADA